MLKPQKHVFPSGLTLITVPMKNSPTVTAEVMVETGSKYEKKEQGGLSHFLEHMCFKGTPTRPTSEILARELDELGAQYNAYTSTEMTAYFAKGRPEHVNKLLDVVSDMYINSVFNPMDLKKEKGVILQEINLSEDKPERIANRLFDKTAHGDQPAGRSVLGTKNTTQSFTSEDFRKYRDSHYKTKATTVIVAGDVNPKDIQKSVAKFFAAMPRGSKPGKEKVMIKRTGPRIGVHPKETDQVHFLFGTRTFPYGNKNNAALSAMTSVLSSGFSSRLLIKMREELGICYYVTAHNDPSTDHGEFAVSTGVDPKRLDIAIEAVAEEFKRLANEKVPVKELSKSIEKRVSNMYMSLESSDDVADYFGHRWLFNRDIKTPKEVEKEIRSVTPESIQRVARTIFTPENVIFSVVGRGLTKEGISKLVNKHVKNW